MQKRETKIASAMVISLSVLTVLVGFVQIQASLSGPFKKASSKVSSSSGLAANANNAQTVNALKTKDTDSDGLSDYDELYAYRTSPYLKDSDSDGIDDATEVNQATDPNCPQGTDCTSRRSANSTEQIANSNLPFAISNTPLNPELGQGASIADLRNALRASGVTEEQLSQIDDATLRDMYNQVRADEAASNTNVQGNTGNAGNVNTIPPDTLAALTSLTPQEIRALMISSGVPKETLDQVDDATLQQIFLQTLSEQSTQ